MWTATVIQSSLSNAQDRLGLPTLFAHFYMIAHVVGGGTVKATAVAMSSSSSVVPAVIAPSFSSLASSISTDKYWVGGAWMISSALLTTYSTTRFLKHEERRGVVSSKLAKLVQQPNQQQQQHDTMETQFKSILSAHDSSHQQRTMKQSQPQHQIIAATTSNAAAAGGGGLNLSRASLLTLYRFSGSLLLGLLLHTHFYQLPLLLPRISSTIRSAKLFLLPSLFLFIANYSNSIALDKIGISLTYTSKCAIPMITVLLTIALDGMSALPSTPTLMSLIPIALGIGASSWNSPTFGLLGFVAALISTTSQAALNVVSKRVMKRTGIHGVEAQRAMVFVALGIGLLMTTVSSIGQSSIQQQQHGGLGLSPSTTTTTTKRTDVAALHQSHHKEEKEGSKKDTNNAIAAAASQAENLASRQQHPPYWLTFVAVLAYHMEYVLSFSFVSMVEPITYGTCDALRRLLIIVAGKAMFGGAKFSNLNLGGMITALVGALLFSITSARGR